MKKGKFITTIFTFLCVSLFCLTAGAQAPSVYKLKIVYIFESPQFESPQTEAILVVGNSGFRSVKTLESWLAGLPEGTTLELDMSCESLGVEPLVNSEEAMNDFKKFCEQHHINLVIHPAG